jgi:hypothetical protein
MVFISACCKSVPMSRLLGLAWLALTALLPLGATARDVVIDSAVAVVEDGYLRVDAKATISVNDDVAEALNNGISLVFIAQTKLLRIRPFWVDETIAQSRHVFVLSRHALSDRYTLTEIAGKPAQTFKTLAEATAALGDLPRVLVLSAIRAGPEENYLGRFRLSLSVEDLPAPMRPLAYVSPGWWLSSGWYNWTFKQ